APEARPAALRFAAGIALCEVLWIARLFLPASTAAVTFVAVVLCELAVPVVAERSAKTAWHPHHISERYGLFTLIVLGETVLSATNAVKEGVAGGVHIGSLISLAAAGLVLVFAMWWLYFDRPGHLRLLGNPTMLTSMSWGYGHYLIFASAAAVGAGLEVAVGYTAGAVHI